MRIENTEFNRPPSLADFSRKQLVNAREVIFSLAGQTSAESGSPSIDAIGFLGMEINGAIPDGSQSGRDSEVLGVQEYADAQIVFDTIKKQDSVTYATEIEIIRGEDIDKIASEIQAKKEAALKVQLQERFPKLQREIHALNSESLNRVLHYKEGLRVVGFGPFPIPGEDKRHQHSTIKTAYEMQILNEVRKRGRSSA